MATRTRIIWFLLAAALLLVAGAPAPEDSTSGEVDVSMSLKMAGEEQATGMPSSFSGHIWFCGNSARMEITMPAPPDATEEQSPAGKMITIIDGDAKAAYILMPETKTAMKMSLSDPQMQSPDQPRNPLSLLDPENYPQGAKITKLGPRSHGGSTVTAYQVSWTSDKRSFSSLFYVNAQQLPVYVETTMPEGKAEMTYSNYKFHKIDPALFKVPEGYQITDMAQMMKGMPVPPE